MQGNKKKKLKIVTKKGRRQKTRYKKRTPTIETRVFEGGSGATNVKDVGFKEHWV